MVAPKEMGRYLTALREKGGFRQNELAEQASLHPAVLSRIESGDRVVSPKELHTILDVIGTDDAGQLMKTAYREWRKLDRPALGHADEDLLWDAEEVLLRIGELRSNPDITVALNNRLQVYEDEITAAANVVRGLEHTVAFVGDIGVGKTTAVCRAAGLEISKDAGSVAQPVLDVGGGGVTVCEVHLVRGPEYGLVVEPRSDGDLYREVREFAEYLQSLVTGEGLNQSEDHDEEVYRGTSWETERAIRNMSGLNVIRQRGEDGTRHRVDPALDLAKGSPDADTLARDIVNRMNLEDRRGREIWYSDLSGKNPLVWLRDTFNEVNYGRNSQFSLPNRIEVMVPRQILGSTQTEIRLVDTKGVDGTVERHDIEARLNERNTIVVLCSIFNSAPSKSVQDLLGRAVRGRFPDLDRRAGVLVLPRPNEALSVKDDDGFGAESVEDGYDLKGDQAERVLKGKGFSYANVAFFNAFEDDPDRLVQFIHTLVEGLRQRRRDDLSVVVNDADSVVTNYRQVEVEVDQRQASRQLQTWLASHLELEHFELNVEDSLLPAMRDAHASSVYASVRRQGNWYNLNYEHHLGFGTRAMVAKSLEDYRNSFKAVADNAKDNHEKAADLVNQAVRIFDAGVTTLLQHSQNLGRTIHKYDLEPDSDFWSDCKEPWGKGLRYRNVVAQRNQQWFDDKRGSTERKAKDLVNHEWDNMLNRVAAILE